MESQGDSVDPNILLSAPLGLSLEENLWRSNVLGPGHPAAWIPRARHGNFVGPHGVPMEFHGVPMESPRRPVESMLRDGRFP